MKDTDALEKWLLFLKGNKQMKEALATESPTMKEAFEEIQRLSEDPATRRIAEYRDLQLRDQIQREYDARKAGIKKGIVQGIEQGAAERDRQIVLNMHAKQTAAAVIVVFSSYPTSNYQSAILETSPKVEFI